MLMKFEKFCPYTGESVDCRDCTMLYKDKYCFKIYMPEFKKALKKKIREKIN